MSTRVTRILGPTLVVLAWSLMPALAPAADGKDAKAKAECPAEKVRKALDQAIDMEMADLSLNQAINQLREQTKLNIVLDKITIQMMGMDPEQMPVTIKVQNAKVRSALRSMLNPYNLSFAILGDSLVVTTEEMAMHRQLKQRVTVDLDKAQLATALKQLSRETATNLIVDNRVLKESQTAVTLQLEDVPLETAVRLMVEMAGLKPVRMGNVLFVTSKANAAELRSDPDLAPPNQPGMGRVYDDIIIGPGGRMMPGGGGGFPVPVPAVPIEKEKDAPPVEKSDKPTEKDKPDGPAGEPEKIPTPAIKKHAEGEKKPEKGDKP